MAKIFVIAGHGAGDSGACGNGYEEAERVRVLAKKLKSLGGDSVKLGDVSRNYYKDNGISKLTIPKSYQIVELHMDSGASSARGGHVIIKSGYSADKYDKALSKVMKKYLKGRSELIVKRSDLGNANRSARMGYGYRLLEVGFISNKEDVKIFNNKMDDIAKDILSSFGIKAGSSSKQEDKKEPEKKKSITEIAKEVISGKWGNGDARKKKLKAAGYDAAEVQKKVNQLLK